MNISALFGGIAQTLGNPVYRRYWTSNTINTTGRWLYRTAVGWLTWELTESTSWLGIIAFADTFPMVIFPPIAGAFADRLGSLVVVRASQFGAALVATVFGALALSGAITIEMVLILTALFGSVEALSVPARMSLIHALVPQRDLAPAIALNSTTFNAARIVGPAIAGSLILWVSSAAVIALSALTFIQFALVLLTIRADAPVGGQAPSRGLIADIGNSVRYALGHRGIRFLMILLGVSGLFVRPFMELLPGFAAQVFDRGPEGLAILLSSIGAGAMISGLWIAQRGRTAGLTFIVTFGVLTSGLSLMLFTVSGHIWLAAFFLVLTGFTMLMGGVGAQTLIQNAVDAAMRARVMSLFVIISWGLPAVGALIMGWLATFFGLQATVAAGALLAVLTWLWARRVGRVLAPELERTD
jgi:MFS family permease